MKKSVSNYQVDLAPLCKGSCLQSRLRDCQKFLSVILSLCMLLSITTGLDLSVYAESSVVFKYTVSDGKARITGAVGEISGDIAIPSTIGGYEVTEIGFDAFKECEGITSVTIPSSVTYIGSWAFIECTSLTSINVDPSNEKYLSQDGVLFTKNKTTLKQYPVGNKRTTYTIPDGVVYIEDDAFGNCQSLTSVIIPDSVIKIYDRAFWLCKNLSDVQIGNNVETILTYAFYWCPKLTSISFPVSLKTIEDKALEYTNITDIYYAGTQSQYRSIFKGKSSCLSTAAIHCIDGVINCYHDFDEGIVTKKETCTEAGELLYTCAICGKTKTQEIEKHHNFDKGVVTKKSTCIEKGIKTYTCTVCGETEMVELELSDHNIVADEAVPPTCTQAGHTIGRYCSVCGEVIVQQSIITAPGHYCVTDNASAPTCTETGLTEGSHCYVCDEVIVAQKVVDATGHKFDGGKVTKSATCTVAGTKTYTCTVCGATKTETIKATGHKVVTDKAVKATYAKAGKTEGSHCKTCGKVIVAQKTVAKLTVPKITLSSVKSSKSKQITVAWKKNTKVTGYEIQYATNSGFTKNKKTVTVSKNSTTSKTISKLKGKTKYYVRIRAYKTENGKKYYSSWSSAKSVTTKK